VREPVREPLREPAKPKGKMFLGLDNDDPAEKPEINKGMSAKDLPAKKDVSKYASSDEAEEAPHNKSDLFDTSKDRLQKKGQK
jgi:hypothetical protein